MSILTVSDISRAKSRWVTFIKSTGVTCVAGQWYAMLRATGNVPAQSGYIWLNQGGHVIGSGPNRNVGYPNLWNDSQDASEASCFYDPATEQAYIAEVIAQSNTLGVVRWFDHLNQIGIVDQSTYAQIDTNNLESEDTMQSNRWAGMASSAELWESRMSAAVTTAFSNVQVGYYLDQYLTWNGLTRSFSTTPPRDQWDPMPLAAGDCGLRGLADVQASASGVGSFEVNTLRPLFAYRIGIPNEVIRMNFFDMGCIPIGANAALMPLFRTDSATNTGIHVVKIRIIAL